MVGECTCASPGDHTLMLMRIDASFQRDRERALLGQMVATSEALRRRAGAATNGHA